MERRELAVDRRCVLGRERHRSRQLGAGLEHRHALGDRRMERVQARPLELRDATPPQAFPFGDGTDVIRECVDETRRIAVLGETHDMRVQHAFQENGFEQT